MRRKRGKSGVDCSIICAGGACSVHGLAILTCSLAITSSYSLGPSGVHAWM